MKLLSDFLPVVAFFVAFKLQGFYVATATLIAVTLVQLAWTWFKHRRVERLQLMVAGLVLLFGGLTLVFENDLFLKWKPTLINWGFAIAFLGSAFIGEKPLIQRLMGGQLELAKPLWARLNLAWVSFFVATGALNLYVAYHYSQEIWVDFKLFGLMGLTLAFVLAQGFYLARHLPQEKENAS